jgi:hypothetical protein
MSIGSLESSLKILSPNEFKRGHKMQLRVGGVERKILVPMGLRENT